MASLEVPPDVEALKVTLRGLLPFALSVLLGTASIVMAVTLPATLPATRVGLAGMIYALEGPFQALNGYFIGRARARRFPSSTPAHP